MEQNKPKEQIKKLVEKTDKEIDERVYELYRLGEEEKKILKE